MIKWNWKTKILIILFTSAMLIISIHLFIKWHNQSVAYSESKAIEPSELSIQGYSVESGIYTNTIGDAQIYLPEINAYINNIAIVFSEPLPQSMIATVYYAEKNHGYIEGYSVRKGIVSGSKKTIIPIGLNVTTCRVDIGEVIGESFSLEKIILNDNTVRNDEILTTITKYVIIYISTILLFFLVLIVFFCDWETFLKKWRLSQEGVYKLYRYRIIVFFSILFLLVALQINNSSMRCYDRIIPNNIAEVKMITWGTPRPIRSDEYFGLAEELHNQIVGYFSMMWEKSETIIQRINSVITIINPYYWGKLFLPAPYIISWTFVMKNGISLFAFYKLFLIITKNKIFSIVSTFILMLSPGHQWWGGPGEFGMLCGIIVLFHEFFEMNTLWKKGLCAYGLVCLTSAIVSQIYPAWDIPLVYLYIFILIGIYASEKKINFHKHDIPFILITSLLMLIVIAAYLTTQNTEIIAATVYPGQRFSTGGEMSINSFLGNYLLMPFTPWGDLTFAGSNLSEISSFIHLFPIPFVIYIMKFKEFKDYKVITSIFAFCLFCMFYMMVGIGEVAAKFTLMSYTTTKRLSTIWGFAGSILFLLECYHIIPIEVKRIRDISITKAVEYGILNITIIIFIGYVAYRHREYVAYAGILQFGCIAFGLVLLGNLLFFGRKKVFLFAMCLVTVISGANVNPINFGISIMTDTPLAVEIRNIDKEDSGRWITLNDFFLSKYIYAQGVDCINRLSWPPRFDLFEPLDEDGEFSDIYNRYAHVIVQLTNEKTSFELNQGDLFTIYLNTNDLLKWDVKYILSKGDLLEDIDSEKLTIAYHDELDNVNIYKLNSYEKE